MDNSKAIKRELDILLIDSLSLNEDILDTLELLSEDLDIGMSLDLYRPIMLAH